MTPEEEEELILQLRRDREAREMKRAGEHPSAVFAETRPVRPKRERQTDPGDGSVDRIEDVLATMPWLLPKFGATTVGLPRDMADLTDAGLTKAAGALPEGWPRPSPEALRFMNPLAGARVLPGSQDVRGAIESVTGPMYDPKSRVGKGVETAVMTGLNLGKNALTKEGLKMIGSTTAATEVAGAATGDDPLWRALAGIAGGGASTFHSARRNAVGDQLYKHFGDITPEEQRVASNLMSVSRKPEIDVPLAGTEALDKGSSLLSYLNASLGGRKTMEDFFKARPAKVEAAADRGLTLKTGNSGTPQENIPRAYKAADARDAQLKENIGGITKPWYDAGATQLAGPDTLEGITHAILGARVGAVTKGHHDYLDKYRDVFGPPPAMTGRKLDRMNKEVRDEADKLNDKLATSAEKADAFDASQIHGAVDYARNQLPGIAQGSKLHSYYMKNVYEPIMEGPLGKLTGKMPPGTPLSSGMVDDATSLLLDPKLMRPADIRSLHAHLSAADPAAFPALAKTHFENVLGKAFTADRAGPNPAQGQRVYKALYGNEQLAANTDEVMRGLARSQGLTGSAVEDFVQGTRNMMQVFERTGRTPPVGSMTHSRGEISKDLSQLPGGGVISPTPVQGFKDNVGQWLNQRRDHELARVLTDPQAIDKIIKMAKLRPNGLTMRYYLSALFGIDRAATEP